MTRRREKKETYSNYSTFIGKKIIFAASFHCWYFDFSQSHMESLIYVVNFLITRIWVQFIYSNFSIMDVLTLLRNYETHEYNHEMLGARSKFDSPCTWFMHPMIIFSKPTWWTRYLVLLCDLLMVTNNFSFTTNPNLMHQRQYWGQITRVSICYWPKCCVMYKNMLQYDDDYTCINMLLTRMLSHV